MNVLVWSSTARSCGEALQTLDLRMDYVVLDAESATYDYPPILVVLSMQI